MTEKCGDKFPMGRGEFLVCVEPVGHERLFVNHGYLHVCADGRCWNAAIRDEAAEHWAKR